MFPDVHQALGLSVAEAGLFGHVPPADLPAEFAAGVRAGADLALSVNTEKARSEFIIAPVLAVVEAKNDNLRNGLGQCIAAMVAAREFNAAAPVGAIYGAVTTGAAWRFLRLVDSALTLDRHEYYLAELGRIVGILGHILTA